MINSHKQNLMMDHIGRRKFLRDATWAAGSIVVASPLSSFATTPPDQTWTVGQIMDLFIQEVPGGLIPNTVDTLHAGDRDMKVTGIVTTMFATIEVIKKAIDLRANFIIAHEPTYYTHTGKADWLEALEVYKYKSELLKKNNIAIWRNHDHIHRHFPDGVKSGVINRLGWEKYFDASNNQVVIIPEMSLSRLIEHIKQKLGITTLRYIGDLSQPCRKILFNPGFNTGSIIIPAIEREKPDVVLGGEFHEWEAPEYVRDMMLSGKKIAMVIMGHADSEEPGSEYLVQWLKEKVKGIKVVNVPAKNPLSFM